MTFALFRSMTLLLLIVAFGSGGCAFIAHELHKAPLGVEVDGEFFVCAESSTTEAYGSDHGVAAFATSHRAQT